MQANRQIVKRSWEVLMDSDCATVASKADAGSVITIDRNPDRAASLSTTSRQCVKEWLTDAPVFLRDS